MDQASIPGFFILEHLSKQSSSEQLSSASSCPQVSDHQTFPGPHCVQGQREPDEAQGNKLQQNCPSGLLGRLVSAQMKERTSKGMPPFFIELGNELIIVHLGCVILDPSNGAKT